MTISVENSSDLVRVETPCEGIWVVTLNRPKARNAVSFELWNELNKVLHKAETVMPRAIILTGAGKIFCAGGDIKTPPARGDSAMSAGARLELGQRVMARLRNLPIPVIAAVEGGAYGIGWSLALACDMIISSRSAKYCAPFLGLGLVPDGGFVWTLRKQLGVLRASEILYSERIVTAEEALSLGLVSRTVDMGTSVDEAVNFADQIGKGNRHCVELTKRLLIAAETTDLQSFTHIELGFGVLCQNGDEVAALRAKSATKNR